MVSPSLVDDASQGLENFRHPVDFVEDD